MKKLCFHDTASLNKKNMKKKLKKFCFFFSISISLVSESKFKGHYL